MCVCNMATRGHRAGLSLTSVTNGIRNFWQPFPCKARPLLEPSFANPSRGKKEGAGAETLAPGLDPKCLLGSCCLEDVKIKAALNFAPAPADEGRLSLEASAFSGAALDTLQDLPGHPHSSPNLAALWLENSMQLEGIRAA